jgi:hypothetical protein
MMAANFASSMSLRSSFASSSSSTMCQISLGLISL